MPITHDKERKTTVIFFKCQKINSIAISVIKENLYKMAYFLSSITPICINHNYLCLLPPHPATHIIYYKTNNTSMELIQKKVYENGGEWMTWLGSTGWCDLTIGAGAHIGSGAETISTWTPADGCKWENDTRSKKKQGQITKQRSRHGARTWLYFAFEKFWCCGSAACQPVRCRFWISG